MQKTMLHAVCDAFLPQLESKCWPVNFRALRSLPRTRNAVLWATRCEIGSLSADVNIGHRSRNGRAETLERLSEAEQRIHYATESTDNDILDGAQEQDDSGKRLKQSVKRLGVGAFQQLPVVSPSYEISGSAVRRAKMVRPTKGIANVAKRERNRGAKQLDALTKELTSPLKVYVQKFPDRERFHKYEQALLELTLGEGTYEETLQRVDMLRKKVLDVGKIRASFCAKSTTKKEAEERLVEGIQTLEELFATHGRCVDDLKEVAKVLRAMPVVHPETPTLCLVGAPNVGKSSLVRILSSGKPEVCNYPFTTRGISMGHILLDSLRYQVTDTPGLLKRPDERRNNIEKLTLAALSYLPTAVLYVHDLTGECGTTVVDQWHIYKEIRSRFSDRPWLDVLSKADLLPPPQSAPVDEMESYSMLGPPGAFRISVKTEEGVSELVTRVHAMLARELSHPKAVPNDSEEDKSDVTTSITG